MTGPSPSTNLERRPSPAERGDTSALRRRRRSGRRPERLGAFILCAPYLILLAVAGVVPAAFAIVESLRRGAGVPNAGHGLLANYKRVVSDYRFVPAFIHIGITLLVWIPMMLIIVVGLALLMHQRPGKLSRGVQFVLYLPGALAGIANFVLWLFLLDPSVSPVRFISHGFGYKDLDQVAQPAHLPLIITLMLIFQGCGTWIVVVYGGLNNISAEILEAATLDGARAGQIAWHVKMPLIRPWLGYLALLNIAYGVQLFLEPSVLGEVTHGLIPSEWSPNELTYTYAYRILDTGGAAALSVILLIVTGLIGLLVVTRTNLLGEGQR